MSWEINYSSQAVKFLKKNPPHSDGVKNCLGLFIKKITGETVSIDIKNMKGEWEGSLRIRKGDIRIILNVDEDLKIIHIKIIDFRGSVY